MKTVARYRSASAYASRSVGTCCPSSVGMPLPLAFSRDTGLEEVAEWVAALGSGIADAVSGSFVEIDEFVELFTATLRTVEDALVLDASTGLSTSTEVPA